MHDDHPVFLTTQGRRLPGVRRAVTVANPNAGADWSVAVPSGVMWRIVCGFDNLATSAAAGSRITTYVVKVDGVKVFQSGAAGNQAASNSWPHSFSPYIASMAFFSAAVVMQYPVPDMLLPQGATFGTQTAALDVLDQYSQIALLVDEVYVTNQQLSQRHHEHEQAERRIERDLSLALTSAPGTTPTPGG